ncbi:MAG: hypothetical protein HOV68_09810 [Streptomycetaceae bacterium]|nr:hypothetical protein [Streptomycetaceae bacterium]
MIPHQPTRALAQTLPTAEPPPAGHADRFTRRWHLVGLGVSNVWKYADLELSAPSGRSLLRGPNGTGKTTAAEALLPYLLDLNAARLAAGKGRPTTLTQLMRTGTDARRRIGYLWHTYAGPHTSPGTLTYGVRLAYSDRTSTPVEVTAFRCPGRPLHELPLHGPDREALDLDVFRQHVDEAGGAVFADHDHYVDDLGRRVYGTDAPTIRDLTVLLRAVRNPSLLAGLSPADAASELRASLPTISEEILEATAEALDASRTTREAFDRERRAANLLRDFNESWSGHARDVVAECLTATTDADRELSEAQAEVTRTDQASKAADEEREAAATHHAELTHAHEHIAGYLTGLEQTDAFKANQQLTAERAQLAAYQTTLHAQTTTMASVCAALRGRADQLTARLNDLDSDLQGETAQIAAHTGPCAPFSLAAIRRPQPEVVLDDATIDPGPLLTVDATAQDLGDLADDWRTAATGHQRRAEAARLALVNHRAVDEAGREAQNADDAATRDEATASREAATASGAADDAHHAAVVLLDDVHTWRGGTGRSHNLDRDWPDVLEDLGTAEPAFVLHAVGEILDATRGTASAAAAERRSHANRRDNEAAAFEAAARRLREQAAELRKNPTMPLPRPVWARAGDDSAALGSAVDWQPHVTPRERAMLEHTLAAAGILGATLHTGGAATPDWYITRGGPAHTPNLLDVLTPFDGHPQAEHTADILRQIALADHTGGHAADGDPALIVGRNGTFRAGPLHGRIPEADHPEALPPASHIGAEQRRAAALRRADELDRDATRTETEAQQARTDADRNRAAADAIEKAASDFPSRSRLGRAETARASAAKVASEFAARARSARQGANELIQKHHELFAHWKQETQAQSLPPDAELLDDVVSAADAAAGALNDAARRIGDRLRRDFARALGELRGHTEAHGRMDADHHEPIRRTLAQLAAVQGRIDGLTNRQDLDTDAVLASHKDATEEHARIDAELKKADRRKDDALTEQTKAHIAAGNAVTRQQRAQPAAENTAAALRTIIGQPGVHHAVLGDAAVLPGRAILAQVTEALSRPRTMTRRTVRERADIARAHLAGMWEIEPGDEHPTLLTYQLSTDGIAYSPPRAAAYAGERAALAETRLRVADDEALHTFVIGRLPAAIGTAWTALHSQIDRINTHMATATASSGVGVRVTAKLRTDLSPAEQTVYELCCRISDADRTTEQQRHVGEALRALIDAADSTDADTMADRLADALDVRTWIDLGYRITRPGTTAERWSSRTGLSGGERRLVVLAPMLAAVAARYDRFGNDAARLVVLDEIPAEVDPAGRDGLARLVANLDLDLLCTGHEWDGAPGAWDGIDIHELEPAGADDVVVAFPVHVRGLTPLPGDPEHPDTTGRTS